MSPAGDPDHREMWSEINETKQNLAKHLGECGIRHADIVRRQEESARNHSQLRADMQAGFAELRGLFTRAHADNQQAIAQVQSSGLERWLKVAGTILLAIGTGVGGYLLKGGT